MKGTVVISQKDIMKWMNVWKRKKNIFSTLKREDNIAERRLLDYYRKKLIVLAMKLKDLNYFDEGGATGG